MKKQKISLKKLKVESFVTSDDKMNTATVKGGVSLKPNPTHPTVNTFCYVCPEDRTIVM